jgi:hypothetical protein
MYKVNNFIVSDSLFSYSFLQDKFGVKFTSDYLVLYNIINQQISFNSGKYKVLFQLDGSIFKSSIKEIPDTGKYVTFAKQLDAPVNMVIHDNNFKTKDILFFLFGLEIEESNDDEINFDVIKDTSNSKIDISIIQPTQINITITPNSVTIDGEEQKEDFSYTKDTVRIKSKLAIDKYYDYINRDLVVSTMNDDNINEYYYEFDVENNILLKKQIEFSDELYIDNYSSVLRKIKDSTLGVNLETIYDYEADWYPDTTEVSIINAYDKKVKHYPISRLISACTEEKNGVALYDYGYFKSSHKLIVTYCYVSSSYAYLTYTKSKITEDVCDYTSDVELETGLKLKIKKGKAIEVKTNNLDKLEWIRNDADFVKELLNKLKHGVGIFYNHLFTLKKYKDDTKEIDILYNYKNKDNNYNMHITDQTTRYLIEDTKNSDGDSTTQTVRYYRYKTYPIVEMSSTKSQVQMNKKKFYDILADEDNGTIYYSKIIVPPLSVVEKNSTLNVNSNNNNVTFKREKISTNLLARLAVTVDDEVAIIKSYYQPRTAAIYGVVNDEIYSGEDFKKFFNDASDFYHLDITCDYTKISYKNLAGDDIVLEFPVSTIFVSAPYNSKDGRFYRIYYKNIQDIGVIEAINYNIVE